MDRGLTIARLRSFAGRTTRGRPRVANARITVAVLAVAFALRSVPASAQAVAPAPIAAPTVPVAFILQGDRVGNYVVTVQAGAVRGSCRVPCSLRLPSGRARIDVSGDVNLWRSLTIPRHESTVRVRTREEGSGVGYYVVTGTLLAMAGTALAVVGWWQVAITSRPPWTGFGGTEMLATLATAFAVGGFARILASGSSAREDAIVIHDNLVVGPRNHARPAFVRTRGRDAVVAIGPPPYGSGVFVGVGLRF